MGKKKDSFENWGYPNTVWFGNGRIADLPKACKILNIKKPLLVTDKELAKTNMVLNAIEVNKKNSLPTEIFSDLKGVIDPLRLTTLNFNTLSVSSS